MEIPQTKFQTSFVPQKPVVSSDVRIGQKKGNILTLIATFIFLATLLTAGGVFFWRLGIQKTIDGQITDLENTRKRIDEKVIAKANRLNDRIIAVKKLLDNHKSPSVIFTVLEDFTLKTVQYLKFSYKIDEKGSISVSGNGLGQRYESIVLQSDSLGQDANLRDLVFSSVQPTADGLISFAFQARIDNETILYRKNIDKLVEAASDNELAPQSNTPDISTDNNTPEIIDLSGTPTEEEPPIDNNQPSI